VGGAQTVFLGEGLDITSSSLLLYALGPISG
jgi:hypothetical protein